MRHPTLLKQTELLILLNNLIKNTSTQTLYYYEKNFFFPSSSQTTTDHHNNKHNSWILIINKRTHVTFVNISTLIYIHNHHIYVRAVIKCINNLLKTDSELAAALQILLYIYYEIITFLLWIQFNCRYMKITGWLLYYT